MYSLTWCDTVKRYWIYASSDEPLQIMFDLLHFASEREIRTPKGQLIRSKYRD